MADKERKIPWENMTTEVETARKERHERIHLNAAFQTKLSEQKKKSYSTHWVGLGTPSTSDAVRDEQSVALVSNDLATV
ncbi:hypothetical protein KIN20_015056 [Parelaphostrongylus tenuis]|uniref:Uncharacterized protein n=1 Tax=Parelaphostrongylus tenuis TaxID=148309 RepID=A0AAD5MY04_PARTN|nr:hypothetical protein KIN20_015056 [Parelaphostrongylus tenuis]